MLLRTTGNGCSGPEATSTLLQHQNGNHAAEEDASNIGPLTLAVGEVSHIGRGRHTTRHVSLLRVRTMLYPSHSTSLAVPPEKAALVLLLNISKSEAAEQVAGGLLADTPGFNQPALEGVTPEILPHYFPEIAERLNE